MRADEPVIVVAVIPGVEGWDQEKGQYALTFFGKEGEERVTPYPANNITTHEPDVKIPVLPELEALAYCFKNIMAPAAIPVAGLSEQLKRFLNLD